MKTDFVGLVLMVVAGVATSVAAVQLPEENNQEPRREVIQESTAGSLPAGPDGRTLADSDTSNFSLAESLQVPSVSDYVYEVRVRGYNASGQAVYSGGSGVAIEGDKFATCSHLMEGMRTFKADVKVSGTWREGVTRIVSDYDLAVVTVNDVDVEPVETRPDKYMEPVEVLGMKSGIVQNGICSDADDGQQSGSVSLHLDESGVVQGDSGGGVFGCDGKLIGILRGHRSNNNNVVLYTPVHRVLSSGVSAPAKMETLPQQPGCVNGQCPVPSQSFQRFKLRRRR